ncbi:hypothetical protein NL388_30500, partial [Klebsiella pneumoniae]|nr:hypothetical protein [Klebsiella pneumoniae]
MSQKILQRYEQLLTDSASIKAMTKKAYSEYSGSYDTLGDEGDALYLEWKVKVKNLLLLSCGEHSIHYRDFLDAEETQS